MYYSRPPAGLLVWRGCSSPPFLPISFLSFLPLLLPSSFFYGSFFGRRPEAAPWRPLLLPSCLSPSRQPLFVPSLSPPPRVPPYPGFQHLCEDPHISSDLAPLPALTCSFPRVPGWPCAQERLSRASPSPPDKPHVSSRKGSVSPRSFRGQKLGGLEGGENICRVSGNGLARPPWNVEEGKQVSRPSLLCFLQS